jgi:hypothetical protein
MVLTMVRVFLRIVFFILLVPFFSCEEQGTFANCDDCSADEPFTATLELLLDRPQYGSGKVYVYEGNLEDSILYATLNPTSENISLIVNLNKLYTATATYYIPGDYFIVVDSATPQVKFTESQCEEPCYYVYDRKLDLRLK